MNGDCVGCDCLFEFVLIFFCLVVGCGGFGLCLVLFFYMILLVCFGRVMWCLFVVVVSLESLGVVLKWCVFIWMVNLRINFIMDLILRILEF